MERAGWTTPPFARVGPLCELCPQGQYGKPSGVRIGLTDVLREPLPGERVAHEEVHLAWARTGGRPRTRDLGELRF